MDVTSLAEVWIEIASPNVCFASLIVTSLAEVWIEINISAEIFAEISKVLLIKLQIVKKYRTNIRFILYFFYPE